jgi:hypothetical protein
MKSFEMNPVIERLSSDFFRQLDPRRNPLNFALIFIPITVFLNIIIYMANISCVYVGDNAIGLLDG